MYWKDNHGNVYGPFNEQEDGFPDAGEVVRHYRMLRGFSQRTLAAALGVHRSWVIKMENENAVPELLSRRRLLSTLLNIPPVLLSISVLGSDMFLEHLETCSPAPVTSYSLQEASEYLNAAWDAHTFTGSSSILPGIRKQKSRIAEHIASGSAKGSLELLHRYEFFLLRAGRTKQDYVGTNPRGLIDLARQIGNPETLGISLYQRGRMYYEQQQYQAALRDIREAVALVKHAGPQVKGLVLSGAGSILAPQAEDTTDVREVLKILGDAETCIDGAKSDQDLFRSWFDESQYFVGLASSLIPLLRLDRSLIDRVFAALDLAQERTKPHYTRRRSNIELLYADAAFHAGDYLASACTALEALELAQSFNLVWNIKRIQELYNKLSQTQMKGSAELKELGQALLRK